ncbi:hypothetical protein BKA70DRAFT_1253201 [Coprinopsis sp. MPI-PUGE-AT-0042]|nr:hypothetical protein BKA70DRAFT_1253201 [Coprinopsis sp. MPI-PUGE-AT-0042]
MSFQLTDLLCRTWYGDSWLSNVIKFEADGTGEILRTAELSLHIAAHFTWRVLAEGSSITPAASTISRRLSSILSSSTQALATAQIEITLSTRTDHISFIKGPLDGWDSGVGRLLPDAFLPRTFSLKFEKGEFISANPMPSTSLLPILSRRKEDKYELRMTCDPNPLPRLENWTEECRQGLTDCIGVDDWFMWVADPLKRGGGLEG